MVIGAGNTAIDICQDLALTGVGEVTMIQRSSTCVMGRDFMTETLKHVFPEGVPMAVSDLRNAALPYGLLKKLNIQAQPYVCQAQKELHDKLRKAGIHLNMGPDGAGLFFLVLGRFGGTFESTFRRVSSTFVFMTLVTGLCRSFGLLTGAKKV